MAYRIVQRSITSWREDGTPELLREGGTHESLTAALIELDARNWIDGSEGSRPPWNIESDDHPDTDDEGRLSEALQQAITDAADTYDPSDVYDCLLALDPDEARAYMAAQREMDN